MVTIHTTDELGISLDGPNNWIAIPETDEDIEWIVENPNLLKQIYVILDRNDPKDIN